MAQVNAIPGGTRLAAALLDAVIEGMPVGVLVLDAEMRVVRANAVLCEMAGVSEAEQLGRPVGDVLEWMPQPAVRRALETGEDADDVDLGERDPGLGRRLAVSLRVLADHEGARAVACLVRDVTELVAWRRGLGGIEELVAELAGAATQAEVTGIILSRSRDLVGAETVAAGMLSDDATQLELVGSAGLPDDTERDWGRFDVHLRTPMGDVARTGRPVFLDGPGNHLDAYADMPAALAGVTVAAVPIRVRGGVIGGLSFRFGTRRRLEPGDRSVMVTLGEHYGQALDRARLFESAEGERQRLSTLMDQLPVGVAIAEAPSGHIVAVNPKATEIWRAPPPGGEPITDVTPYVAFHPDGRRFSTDDWPIARSLATGEVVESEVVDVQFGDGSRGYVNISARPIYDAAGYMLGAVTTLVDVTEARRRETEARFIADAADLLAESLDPEETLRRLARLVVPRLADWCVVHIRDGSRIRTVALEHSDPAKIELGLELQRRYPTDPDGESGVAEVMRTGVSVLTRRITREMAVAAAPDSEFAGIVFDQLGLRSALTVPLRARGELFGALILVSAESDRMFDERDLRFAEDVATHA
ncbi:MAG TPA: GAF domain-containing protein, partial [Gaiellales bacterium]